MQYCVSGQLHSTWVRKVLTGRYGEQCYEQAAYGRRRDVAIEQIRMDGWYQHLAHVAAGSQKRARDLLKDVL